MYINILSHTVLANPVKARKHRKLPTKTVDQSDLFLAVEQRTVGCLVATNHNKAAVCVLISQPITASVGHLCWQLPVAVLVAASDDPVHVQYSLVE